MSFSALAVCLYLCGCVAEGIKVNEAHPPSFLSKIKETSLAVSAFVSGLYMHAHAHKNTRTGTPEDG